MAKVAIPDSVHSGFLLIADLPSTDLHKVIGVLASIKSGDELESVEQKLNIFLENKGRTLLQTIISFSALLEKDGATTDDVANNLYESFIELSKIPLNKQQKELLLYNLGQLLLNVRPLRKNINSRRSQFENESILRSTDLITDFRILFQDDLADKNRDAVIMHKMHVQYQHNFNDKEIYFTLDLKDLNRLKSQIEKAIEKDQILREDFKDKLNILF